jgi:hypothetical protein
MEFILHRFDGFDLTEKQQEVKSPGGCQMISTLVAAEKTLRAKFVKFYLAATPRH